MTEEMIPQEEHAGEEVELSLVAAFYYFYPARVLHTLWMLAWTGFMLFIWLTHTPSRGMTGFEGLGVFLIGLGGMAGHAFGGFVGWMVSLFRPFYTPPPRHPRELSWHLNWLAIWFFGGGMYLYADGAWPYHMWVGYLFGVFPIALIGHILLADALGVMALRNSSRGQTSQSFQAVLETTPARGSSHECPRCGEPRMGDYRFCPECGEELPAMETETTEIPGWGNPSPAFLEITIRPQTLVLIAVLGLVIVFAWVSYIRAFS